MSPLVRRCAELLLLGLLMVVPALGLVPVHGSGAPVFAWACGVAVAVVAGAVCAATSLPAWVGVPLGVLLVVLTGPSVVTGAVTAPVGTELRELLQGAVSGWREVVTVAVPIGTSGTLLVPALLTGLVVGTVSTVATASERWSASALLGLPLGAVVAGLLGQGSQPWWATTAVLGAAVLGLVWVVARRGEGTSLVAGAPSLRWRRPVTAGVVLVLATAAGTGTILAADSGTRLAVRETLAVPVEPVTVPSPLVEYRHLTVDLADTPLLTVDGVQPGDRIRIAALDAYDGVQFTVGETAGAFARLGTRRAVAATGTDRTVTTTVSGWAGAHVPTLGELQSISFTGPRAGDLVDTFRYSAPALTGVVPDGLRAGDSWVQTGVVTPPADPAAVAGDRLVTDEFPSTVTVPEVIRAAAAEYTDGIAAPGDQLRALQEVLSSRGYFSRGLPDQLRSPAGHGLNRLVEMVSSTTMVGDDEQYAALMALLARSMGIPARVVVGVEIADGEGSVTVHGADLAAWVEVPFAGAGWVAYDPTPPRDRTELDTDPPARAGRHVADNQPPPAAAAGDQAQVQADSSGTQEERTPDDAPSDRPGVGLPWWGWTLIAVAALLFLAALPMLVVVGWKSLRRRRRRGTADPAGRVRAAWREVLDVARDTGFHPAATATRAEISRELLTVSGVDTLPLAGAADLAEFAPFGAAGQEADRHWTAATRASTALWRSCRRPDAVGPRSPSSRSDGGRESTGQRSGVFRGLLLGRENDAVRRPVRDQRRGFAAGLRHGPGRRRSEPPSARP